MVLKKVKSSDLKDLDTRQRIKEAAMNLFALKGFEGASIREIAQTAEVNVAAINYHFKSKENLREEITGELFQDFLNIMASLDDSKSLADFATRFFITMTADAARCVNQFKIFIESDTSAFDKDTKPLGYDHIAAHMAKDLNKSVPEEERLWLMHVLISYTVHTAVMSSTKIGQRKVKKFFCGGVTSVDYISKLVESLVRDLNTRYPA